MSSLDIIVYSAIILPIFFVLGNNLAHFNDTKKWLDSHGIDNSFYENREKKRKNDSLRSFVNYYLGWPGRHIAYKLHSKNLR